MFTRAQRYDRLNELSHDDIYLCCDFFLRLQGSLFNVYLKKKLTVLKDYYSITVLTM